MRRRFSKPVLSLPRSPIEIGLEISCLISFSIMIYLIIHSWQSLPNSIPIHYNASGSPDAWGSKGILVILPALSLCNYALLTLLAFIPQIYHYP